MSRGARAAQRGVASPRYPTSLMERLCSASVVPARRTHRRDRRSCPQVGRRSAPEPRTPRYGCVCIAPAFRRRLRRSPRYMLRRESPPVGTGWACTGKRRAWLCTGRPGRRRCTASSCSPDLHGSLELRRSSCPRNRRTVAGARGRAAPVGSSVRRLPLRRRSGDWAAQSRRKREARAVVLPVAASSDDTCAGRCIRYSECPAFAEPPITATFHHRWIWGCCDHAGGSCSAHRDASSGSEGELKVVVFPPRKI
jgi:hypothetical protein